jgi:hypothetical protein
VPDDAFLQFADGLMDSTELLVARNNLAGLAVGLRECSEVPHNIEHMCRAERARHNDLLAAQPRPRACPHSLWSLLGFPEEQGRAGASGFLGPHGSEGVCRFCDLGGRRDEP